MESQVSAQQSVIEGLREERKLWGKELAHQGASLAQDRGRLQAELDSLTKEAGHLRQQLQEERDAVRVKRKQLDDQSDTIQTLKRTVGELGAELQGGKAGLEGEVRELRLRLEQEEMANVEMQEQLQALLGRKEELKEELATHLEEKEVWEAKFK